MTDAQIVEGILELREIYRRIAVLTRALGDEKSFILATAEYIAEVDELLGQHTK